jgi:hypothetical protein
VALRSIAIAACLALALAGGPPPARAQAPVACPLAAPGPTASARSPGVVHDEVTRPDERTTRERITLASGETLRVEHLGCEYDVLRIRLDSTRLASRPSRPEDAFRDAARAISAFAALRPDTVFDLARVERALLAAAARHEPVPLGAPLPVSDEEPAAQAAVTSWERDSTRGHVEVELTRGAA